MEPFSHRPRWSKIAANFHRREFLATHGSGVPSVLQKSTLRVPHYPESCRGHRWQASRTGEITRFVQLHISLGHTVVSNGWRTTQAVPWSELGLKFEFCNHSCKNKKGISKRTLKRMGSLDSTESQTQKRAGRFQSWMVRVAQHWAILKMSGFAPYSFYGHFLGRPLEDCRVLPHPDFFVNFGPTPFFQLFEALFWPKRRPKIWNFHPTRNFGHFLAPSFLGHLFDFPKCHDT